MKQTFDSTDYMLRLILPDWMTFGERQGLAMFMCTLPDAELRFSFPVVGNYRRADAWCCASGHGTLVKRINFESLLTATFTVDVSGYEVLTVTSTVKQSKLLRELGELLCGVIASFANARRKPCITLT